MPQADTARDRVRREIEKSAEPDPHVMARRLLARLSAAQAQEVLLDGVVALIREEIRFDRMDTHTGKAGPSRRSIALRERVCPGGVWKMLADCDVDDLLVLAEEYGYQAEQLAARERECRALADELRRSGCATVGEMRAAVAA